MGGCRAGQPLPQGSLCCSTWPAASALEHPQEQCTMTPRPCGKAPHLKATGAWRGPSVSLCLPARCRLSCSGHPTSGVSCAVESENSNISNQGGSGSLVFSCLS